MNVYLVIDIGTSSMRGILYKPTGEKLFHVQLSNKPSFLPGRVEQAVADWKDCLNEIMTQMSRFIKNNQATLQAIFLTAQRSSLICLDSDGEPLMPAIMWQDKRSNEITSELAAYNQMIIEKTGAPLNPVYLAPKISWVKRHLPKIAAKTTTYLSIADYIGYQITGEYLTDYTYASRTSLYNIHEEKWDEELLALFNVEKEELCNIIPPAKSGRKARREFLGKFGIENEVAFVSAGGDQQCSAVGMGVLNEGDVAVSLGTGGYILSPVKKIKADSAVILNTYPIESHYILESILPTCASAVDWMRSNFFENLETEEFYSSIKKVLHSNLKTEVIHLPHFQGRGTPDWNNEARAAFLQIDFSVTKEQLLLSLLESIAIELKNNITQIESYTKKSIKKVMVAGGLTNNPAMNQLISDVLEIEIHKGMDAESTALGAFLVGMKALDPTINQEELLKNNHSTEREVRYFPNQSKKAYYEEKREKWNDFYNKINL